MKKVAAVKEPLDVKELRKYHHEQLRKMHEQARQRHRLADNEFYASTAGYCPRYIYYSKKYGAVYDVYLLDIFELGDAVHSYWEKKVVEKFGGETEKDVQAEEGEIRVRGRCDVLDARNVVWEVKSASELPSSPYPEHVYQTMFYVKHLGAKYGVLLYVKKTTNAVRGFRVDLDEDKYAEAVAVWEHVYDCIKEGKLPLKVPSWRCRNCPYREKCESARP